MDRIAVIARIPRNGRIFDLGSGCGTMLNYYHLRYNTTGVGVDVTRDAVDHAHTHRQPGQTFCWTDAAARGAMAHFSDNSFDAVVSWAVLYHVRRTLVQCEIVQHLVRILRPGGVAYIGHLRTEKTQKYWTKGRCQIEGASWHRTKDSRTFRMSSFKRHGFFSVVVTKHVNVNATANASTAVAAEDTDS
jgi:SAM-dependent methyltransferase